MAADPSSSDPRAALSAQLDALNGAEAALVKAMPKLVLAGSCVQFRALIATHLQETEVQATRLKRAAQGSRLELKQGEAPGIERLIAETQRVMAEEAPPLTKDLHLTEAARAIEREEIAAYAKACELAEQSGESELKLALTKTLKEEEAAERLLGALAGELAAGSIQPGERP